MDTISLAGTLPAKLKAGPRRRFSQIMLAARDVVGHSDGIEAAVQDVPAQRSARHGLPGAARFRGPVRDIFTTTRSTSPSRCSRWRTRSARPCCSVCFVDVAHATSDPMYWRATCASSRCSRCRSGIKGRVRRTVVGPHDQRVHGRRGISCAAPTRPNLGIGIDSFHAFATKSSLDDLDMLSPDKIFLVQLADFMWQETRTDEERIATARHFRVFPGKACTARRWRSSCAGSTSWAIAGTTASKSSTTITASCRCPR
jgi:hypothetical protein